jgi:hypothetical protein
MEPPFSTTPTALVPSNESAFRPRRSSDVLAPSPIRYAKLIGLHTPLVQKRPHSEISTKKHTRSDEPDGLGGFRSIAEDLMSCTRTSPFCAATTLRLRVKKPRLDSICHSFECFCQIRRINSEDVGDENENGCLTPSERRTAADSNPIEEHKLLVTGEGASETAPSDSLLIQASASPWTVAHKRS